MWTIDQLKLTLPPGFEHRAERIARRVAEELAAFPVASDVSIRSLSLPPIEISAGGMGASDAAIAGRIARAISESVQTSSNPVAGNRP
ncbi:MAG TPA: hypothetical protein VN493_18685 [Thermoanaerobaculia bacterium]|nr:hypothetical protein [Thermoanaerobaculia bacterium]